MKPTIIFIEVFYTGNFNKNGEGDKGGKFRAGYKIIALCPSRGCCWPKNESDNLTRKIRNGFNGICCPACSRRLVVKKVPIDEQGCENEIKNGGNRNG